MVKRPKRRTRFVRVIAGPHEETCAFCDGTAKRLRLGFMVQFGASQEDALGPCPRCTGGVRKYACVLYTAYGVTTLDMPTAPKEPGELGPKFNEAIAEMNRAYSLIDPSLITKQAVERLAKAVDACDALGVALDKSHDFWCVHALASIDAK